jgi:hypothetical protein
MKIARGIIAFEYKVSDEEEAEGLSKPELESYFTDKMLDDIIDLRFSDIRPAIEMEIINFEESK